MVLFFAQKLRLKPRFLDLNRTPTKNALCVCGSGKHYFADARVYLAKMHDAAEHQKVIWNLGSPLVPSDWQTCKVAMVAWSCRMMSL